MVWCALLVCKVESTKCQVSASLRAISICSLLLISQNIITSGFCLIAHISAVS